MPEWLVIVLASAPGLLAAGGLYVRVNRLEKDVEKCVTREVYAAQQGAINEKLTRIEALSARVLDRLTGYARTPRPGEGTDPGFG